MFAPTVSPTRRVVPWHVDPPAAAITSRMLLALDDELGMATPLPSSCRLTQAAVFVVLGLYVDMACPQPPELKLPPLWNGQLVTPMGNMHPSDGIVAGGFDTAIASARAGSVERPTIPRKKLGTVRAAWQRTAFTTPPLVEGVKLPSRPS